MIITFWVGLFIIFYAFLGYGILLFILIKIKRMISGKPVIPQVVNLPTCTLIVAAYNEESVIEEKIKNSIDLIYPENRLKFIFITDGSTDKTADMVAKYPQIKHMHSAARMGKMAAVHRAVAAVDTDVIVFTDANTFLNTEAIVNICRHYANPKVGAVAGEKRVHISENADATAGEGFYWKYESRLKIWDSELYSVVGAAGELFSVRTALYQPVPSNAIIDDFMISMLIAKKGYKIIYEPDAYALETASEDIGEEMKRKVRIAAGGLQSIIWLKSLLLPFKLPVLSLQYISHRVLRWTVVPFLMILVLLLNILIVAAGGSPFIFRLILCLQLAFYSMSLFGWLLETRQVKVKILFIPFYFCMMNYAVIRGIFRFAAGRQSAVWDKAKRK
ncbi:glycosyltransferase family 2 protein [Mucilaginibacter lappiensis]|uniref:glycosyltransferase family 2 protein n=1 Tax=Mucilaginibacter lappiensis TaxID=354630 RepID=UPI003D2133AE